MLPLRSTYGGYIAKKKRYYCIVHDGQQSLALCDPREVDDRERSSFDGMNQRGLRQSSARPIDTFFPGGWFYLAHILRFHKADVDSRNKEYFWLMSITFAKLFNLVKLPSSPFLLFYFMGGGGFFLSFTKLINGWCTAAIKNIFLFEEFFPIKWLSHNDLIFFIRIILE